MKLNSVNEILEKPVNCIIIDFFFKIKECKTVKNLT